MIYLTLPELLHVAERVLGPGFDVRDAGLLESALSRGVTSRTVVVSTSGSVPVRFTADFLDIGLIFLLQ